MPKRSRSRSVEDTIERYKRKIRKLEKKSQKVIVQSENIQNEQYNDDDEYQDFYNSASEHEEQLFSSDQEDESKQEDIPDPDPQLDPELLAALGESTAESPEFGEPIDATLAELWAPILKKGLSKESKDKILTEYRIPENCKLLQAPKLNPEISAAVSEVVRNRDKKLLGLQKQLGIGITAINKSMGVLLRTENKVVAIKSLSDSCRILNDLHCAYTKDRVKLICPSLEKNFLHVIQDSERDDTLFGTALSEKIKASKAIQQQGSQIKKSYPPPAAKNPPNQDASSGGKGNWTGPSRYQSTRGGRRGGRGARNGQPSRRQPAKSPAQHKPRAQATTTEN